MSALPRTYCQAREDSGSCRSSVRPEDGGAISAADYALGFVDLIEKGDHHRAQVSLGHKDSEQRAVRSRRQQLMAQPKVTKDWWMSSRISQRMRRRRNQCSNAIAPSTTHRYTPSPEPCSMPRWAMCVVICRARTWSR